MTDFLFLLSNPFAVVTLHISTFSLSLSGWEVSESSISSFQKRARWTTVCPTFLSPSTHKFFFKDWTERTLRVREKISSSDLSFTWKKAEAGLVREGSEVPNRDDVGPPPNGGLRAWAQVVMGHLVIFNSWGYVSSFGIFQSHYTTTLNVTPSAISWIGSVQLFLIYFIGTFSGRALDAGYYRTVLICGSSLQIFAIFMTSISSRYWQLFIAQGICKGLGDGLIFCPTVALVATYFSKRRASAMACAASGGATGGMIFPLIAQQLLPKVGFAWTVRVMGFVILLNSIIAISLARVRLPARQTGPLVEWSAFKERRYALFCVAMFFNVWALFFAYFYVSPLPI